MILWSSRIHSLHIERRTKGDQKLHESKHDAFKHHVFPVVIELSKQSGQQVMSACCQKSDHGIFMSPEASLISQAIRCHPHCQTALETLNKIDIINISSGNILFLKCRGACCLGSWLFDQSQSPGSPHDCAASLQQTHVATCYGLPEVSSGH